MAKAAAKGSLQPLARRGLEERIERDLEGLANFGESSQAGAKRSVGAQALLQLLTDLGRKFAIQISDKQGVVIYFCRPRLSLSCFLIIVLTRRRLQGAQLQPRCSQPAHDGSYRNVEDGSSFLVCETFDVDK